jgi:hypothetical protein
MIKEDEDKNNYKKEEEDFSYEWKEEGRLKV